MKRKGNSEELKGVNPCELSWCNSLFFLVSGRLFFYLAALLGLVGGVQGQDTPFAGQDRSTDRDVL